MPERGVAFIGAGVVGTTLAHFLARAEEYEVVGFLSRSLSSARRAVGRVGSGQAACDLRTLLPDADVVFITTPDDAITEVARRVAGSEHLTDGAVLIHTSGAHPGGILRWPSQVNYWTASLHPLQSFADFDSARQVLPGSLAVIEGDERGRREAVRLAEALDMTHAVIQPEAKPLYHAAACAASNYLVVLLELALMLDEEAGLQRQQALAALKPLILGTLQNVEKSGAVDALTGPISRGDAQTVRRHLQAMSGMSDSIQNTYRSLGQAAVQLARRKESITCRQARRLRQMLSIGGDESEHRR